MAQRLPKQIIPPIQLTATAATLYTVPANTLTTIAAATLTNSTATAQTATVHLVPLAGTADATNVVLSERVIAPKESYNVASMIGHTIPAGATIQALSDLAAALTFIASAYETNP